MFRFIADVLGGIQDGVSGNNNQSIAKGDVVSILDGESDSGTESDGDNDIVTNFNAIVVKLLAEVSAYQYEAAMNCAIELEDFIQRHPYKEIDPNTRGKVRTSKVRTEKFTEKCPYCKLFVASIRAHLGLCSAVEKRSSAGESHGSSEGSPKSPAAEDPRLEVLISLKCKILTSICSRIRELSSGSNSESIHNLWRIGSSLYLHLQQPAIWTVLKESGLITSVENPTIPFMDYLCSEFGSFVGQIWENLQHSMDAAKQGRLIVLHQGLDTLTTDAHSEKYTHPLLLLITHLPYVVSRLPDWAQERLKDLHEVLPNGLEVLCASQVAMHAFSSTLGEISSWITEVMNMNVPMSERAWITYALYLFSEDFAFKFLQLFLREHRVDDICRMADTITRTLEDVRVQEEFMFKRTRDFIKLLPLFERLEKKYNLIALGEPITARGGEWESDSEPDEASRARSSPFAQPDDENDDGAVKDEEEEEEEDVDEDGNPLSLQEQEQRLANRIRGAFWKLLGGETNASEWIQSLGLTASAVEKFGDLATEDALREKLMMERPFRPPKQDTPIANTPAESPEASPRVGPGGTPTLLIAASNKSSLRAAEAAYKKSIEEEVQRVIRSRLLLRASKNARQYTLDTIFYSFSQRYFRFQFVDRSTNRVRATAKKRIGEALTSSHADDATGGGATSAPSGAELHTLSPRTQTMVTQRVQELLRQQSGILKPVEDSTLLPVNPDLYATFPVEIIVSLLDVTLDQLVFLFGTLVRYKYLVSAFLKPCEKVLPDDLFAKLDSWQLTLESKYNLLEKGYVSTAIIESTAFVPPKNPRALYISLPFHNTRDIGNADYIVGHGWSLVNAVEDPNVHSFSWSETVFLVFAKVISRACNTLSALSIASAVNHISALFDVSEPQGPLVVYLNYCQQLAVQTRADRPSLDSDDDAVADEITQRLQSALLKVSQATEDASPNSTFSSPQASSPQDLYLTFGSVVALNTISIVADHCASLCLHIHRETAPMFPNHSAPATPGTANSPSPSPRSQTSPASSGLAGGGGGGGGGGMDATGVLSFQPRVFFDAEQNVPAMEFSFKNMLLLHPLVDYALEGLKDKCNYLSRHLVRTCRDMAQVLTMEGRMMMDILFRPETGQFAHYDLTLAQYESFPAEKDPLLIAFEEGFEKGSKLIETLKYVHSPTAQSLLILQCAHHIAHTLERKWLNTRCSEYGVLLMSSQLRAIMSFFLELATSVSVRPVFSRLSQAVSILSLESINGLYSLVIPRPVLSQSEVLQLLRNKSGMVTSESVLARINWKQARVTSDIS